MSLIIHFHLFVILFFGLIWIGAAVFLRVRLKKSFVYLLFFTIFYVYVVVVLDYTLIQFQSLIILDHLMPDHFILRAVESGKNVNLIPLVTLGLADLKTSLLNVLLFVPFGFGLPFVTSVRLKRMVLAGALFSVGIELLQFATGRIVHMTFRVADINDVIFNTIGAAIGCGLFLCFARVVRHIIAEKKIGYNPIARYIVEKIQNK